EKYNRWDHERDNGAEKKLQLMNWEQMREMSESGLVEFGGHTVTHCNLKEISENEAKTEMKKCKEELEEKLEKKVLSFAYPYGFFTEKHEEIAKKIGYKYALATDSGSSDFFENLFHIRRIGIFSKDCIKKYKKKIRGNYNTIKIRDERLKDFRRKIKKILGWKK
ncbi:MAG: polysaccharide deacetylase family protein, partial [Cetobacterium sp.]